MTIGFHARPLFKEYKERIQDGCLAQQKRDDLIRDLRLVEGWSLDAIAEAAGLTKQRISQIVNKR